MKKTLFCTILILAAFFIFSGCSSEPHFSAEGAWRLKALEDYITGEVYDFDEEIYLFNEDGTGIEIYLPGDYNEEYSYITWKRDIHDDSIEIKHDKDYIYDLDIVEISHSELKCSFYYESDPDTYYLATYEKMPEGTFDYVGCWNFSEYYENGEYYDTNNSFLYLFPDGSMQQIYYELEEPVTEYGSWALTGKYLRLEFDGFGSVRYDTVLNSNRLEIHDKNEDGGEITYLYKRYYGQITNTPPATYPQSFWGEVNRFFATILKRINDNLS